MAEARKVFPIQTFAYLLRGKPGSYNQDVLELLSFVTQKEVDKEFAPFASALAKYWVYEEHPELARLGKDEVLELGENISIRTLPSDVQEEVDEVFAKLKEYRDTIEEQKAKISELEGIIEENKKKIAELEAKVKDYEAQIRGEGERLIVASMSKVEEYIKKVDDLLAKIEEVKKHGVVAVSAEGVAAGEEKAEEPGKTKEPEADFGFGGGLSDGEFGL